MADGSRSSSGQTTGTWVGVVTPSVGDLVFVVLMSLLVFTPLSVRLLGDAGIGWHIRTGQQILATHAIPHVDSFSSSMAGKPWYAWEWLYDVVVGWLETAFGLNGVVCLTALVIALVFGGTFHAMVRRGANLIVALVLAMLAVCASTIHFLARPHVLTWLLALIWFLVLDFFERAVPGEQRDHRLRLWILPPLALIWANVHGGFLLGFALLGIFWIAAMWEWITTREDRLEDALRKVRARKRLSSLTRVGLVSALATLVNPYGWKLHAHIYSYLSNRFLMDHIEEFRSPNFHGVAEKCFLVLILVAIAGLMLSGRTLRMSEGITLLFAIYIGIYSARNIPISSILLAIIAAGLWSKPASSSVFFERMTAIERGLRGHAWPILAVVVTLCIAVNGGRLGSTLLMDARFDPKRMPVQAVDHLQTAGIPGPVFAPDSWGGYVIYRSFPGIHVVIDDRHDFYGESFLRSYLKTLHAEADWHDFLNTNRPECVLLPTGSALASVLRENASWQQVYLDDVAVIFSPSRKPLITMPALDTNVEGAK